METRGHADACESGAIIAPSRRDGAGMIRGRKRVVRWRPASSAAACRSRQPTRRAQMAKKAQDDYIDLDSIEPRLYLLTRLVMDDARER
jgi:hypothetical protein